MERPDAAVPGHEMPSGPHDAPPQAFIACLSALNAICGDRAFTPVFSLSDKDRPAAVIPTLSMPLAKANFGALMKLLAQPSAIGPNDVSTILAAQRKAVAGFLPPGTNRLNFIEAAASRRLPFRIFGAPFLIFGYGSGSFILNSSITEGDTSTGLSLARSKVATNQFLRQSGLPVPQQRPVKSEEAVVAFVREFGFPVVLKPDNQSQGRGVIAGIVDEAEALQHFRALANLYPTILIEEHVPGNHYRIDFMGDIRIKAVRRRAATVVGDGQRSIEALIAELNQEPVRLDPSSSTKQVVFDSDLTRTLAKQGLSVSDIPEAGRRVTLKSISNLGMGGVQENVEDEVHPENYDLCRAIARTMRLQVLGVDLLSPDISRPWYENGARICEVNAQPQLGDRRSGAYGRLLDHVAKPPARVELALTRGGPVRHPALFDTAAQTVKVEVPLELVLCSGSPTQYFDTLMLPGDLSETEKRQLDAVLVSVPPQG
ncbi:MAG: hypothetical protein AAGH70_08510 [Pseudomonadota bacterium]